MKKGLLNPLATILVLISLLAPGFSYAQPVVGLQNISDGTLDMPVEIAAPNDGSGRLFIVQQRGRIRIWDGTSILADDFLDLTSLLSTGNEQGLLSMAFHPNYSVNGLFYVYYTNTDGDVTIAAYSVSSTDPNIANTSPEPGSPLIVIPKPFDNHNGGHLQFRPEGAVNYLYFATGDGGSGNDPNNNAQNPASRLGKMIRMDVDASTITPQTWAIGLRNPFRWSFDRSTGDIWIGDVGQELKEEVDYLAGGVAGANYGWRCFEGFTQNTNVTLCDPPDDIPPVFEYDNPIAASSAVTGGYVYRGTEFPALAGYYIAADFYSGQIWLMRSPSIGSFAVLPQSVNRTFISAFGEAADGTLYAISMATNSLYKVIVTAVLPVSLVQFTGSEKSGFNELKWTTATEAGSSKFVVEFSLDGLNFSVAGEVAARGNANGSSYSFSHAINMPGKIYYRLKIVDIDASAKYSPVIELRQDRVQTIKIYPTVISNGRVQVMSAAPVEKVQIFSAEGRLISSQRINMAGGYFTLPLPGLQKGMYFIKLKTRETEKTEKIIIN